MRKTVLTIAVITALTLVGFKYLFPETAHTLIQSAADVLSGDIDYRDALATLGRSIAPSDDEETTAAVTVPVRALNSESTADTAVNLGERQTQTASAPEPEPEPELPAAVTAFLASQEEYSAYALPENVSYDYETFPGSYAVPVAGYSSSGFGYRLHPVHNEVRFHYGTDFAAWSGESILAFAGGTVSFAGYCDSYGNYLTIDHDDGWQSLYAHCSALYVSAGDRVEQGQLIALVGATGVVTGPHLHFELTHNGVYVNPEYYVNS